MNLRDYETLVKSGGLLFSHVESAGLSQALCLMASYMLFLLLEAQPLNISSYKSSNSEQS